MSSLPRVAGLTRERIAREFDDRGPDVCRTEIILDLEANNPELLDVAARCARDVGDFARIMTGFCLFYRLLTAEARAVPGNTGAARQLSLLGSYMGTMGELHEVLSHVFAGRLRPVVDRTFPLGELRAAHEYLEKSQMFGKIVVNP